VLLSFWCQSDFIECGLCSAAQPIFKAVWRVWTVIELSVGCGLWRVYICLLGGGDARDQSSLYQIRVRDRG
jgi:hypothetical protein